MQRYVSLNRTGVSCSQNAFKFMFLCILVFTFIFTRSSLCCVFLFSLSLTVRECNISGKYFSTNQTLVSICSVLLVVLQSLIWQHAALIWLSLHTTTKALNIWAPVSWTRNRMKPTKRDTRNTTAGDKRNTEGKLGRQASKEEDRQSEIKVAVGLWQFCV